MSVLIHVVTFPWWTTTIEVATGVDELDSKCYILRDKEKVWENFNGNRTVYITDEKEVTIHFNGMSMFVLLFSFLF